MILVDTTVWIDYFNGRASAENKALHRLLEKERLLCLTDIVMTEILRGFNKDSEFSQARHQLSQFPCLTAKAPKSFLHAAELYRYCRKKGDTIRSTVDCLIAAVCLENDVALLHHDRDFNVLAKHCGLETINPQAL